MDVDLTGGYETEIWELILWFDHNKHLYPVTADRYVRLREEWARQTARKCPDPWVARQFDLLALNYSRDNRRLTPGPGPAIIDPEERTWLH
jgi:hypothetical protein